MPEVQSSTHKTPLYRLQLFVSVLVLSLARHLITSTKIVHCLKLGPYQTHCHCVAVSCYHITANLFRSYFDRYINICVYLMCPRWCFEKQLQLMFSDGCYRLIHNSLFTKVILLTTYIVHEYKHEHEYVYKNNCMNITQQ